MFDIPKSTVADVWKAQEKIERHVSASDNPLFAKKRCIVKEANFEKLDKAVYTWFIQQRSKGAPVSGPLLQACEAFNTALKWLEAQTDIDPVHLLLVKKWRDSAARKRGENLKQNTISSYIIKQ